jgi:hypothetical protein
VDPAFDAANPLSWFRKPGTQHIQKLKTRYFHRKLPESKTGSGQQQKIKTNR